MRYVYYIKRARYYKDRINIFKKQKVMRVSREILPSNCWSYIKKRFDLGFAHSLDTYNVAVIRAERENLVLLLMETYESHNHPNNVTEN